MAPKKSGGSRRADPRTPQEKLKAKMTAKLEDLRLDERLQRTWDAFCENCRERLERREVWIEVHARHEDDDDPLKTYYCSSCITIDRSRTKRPARG